VDTNAAAREVRDPCPVNGERTSAVSLRDLRRDYNERPVLRGVSLELPPGRTLAVIGPNGAGKSTLLRILATLLRPSAGEVEVLGAGLPAKAWRARGRIGYLGHEPLLYRELSVRENLEFNARLHGLSDPHARIDELLERAGLARRATEVVRNLSAGMLQRAAICRALVHGPELLLLDEPRSHLDLGAVGVVDELLGPQPDRARVIVTHDVEGGLAEADLALALRADGSVAHTGAAAELSAAEARAVVEGRA
jgi:ABC-type multidrug transport system ATPase subunit